MEGQEGGIELDLDGIEMEKNAKNVILISTGAYCPVHHQHLDAFVFARDELKSKYGYNVNHDLHSLLSTLISYSR